MAQYGAADLEKGGPDLAGQQEIGELGGKWLIRPVIKGERDDPILCLPTIWEWAEGLRKWRHTQPVGAPGGCGERRGGLHWAGSARMAGAIPITVRRAI